MTKATIKDLLRYQADYRRREKAKHIAAHLMKEFERVRSQNYGEFNLATIRNLLNLDDLILAATDSYVETSHIDYAE